MMLSRHTTILRTIPFLLAICLVSLPAQAKYSGGTGEPKDPYQIATAADLIALGETPEDYDKHFILTADIDLDPNLPGRKVFDKAVIGFFYGVFDGGGQTISHLTMRGADNLGLFGQLASGGEVKNFGVLHVNVTGSGAYVGGLVGYNEGIVTHCYSTGSASGKVEVGGLVGQNGGHVTQCYSAGAVSGIFQVGGLVGQNSGHVTQCYSTGAASGENSVGGLVGFSGGGRVAQCYSTGAVSGNDSVGGLAGSTYDSIVTDCFWDTQTSGQVESRRGATGKTTAEMQTADTFLFWGVCGNEGVWTINEGNDYPRLWWENRPGTPIRRPALADLLPGTGTKSDPFCIYTPEQLNTVGLYPCEWGKQFKLMADIGLSGFDGKDGKPAFNIIAPGGFGSVGDSCCDFFGTGFTGVFDGNGYSVSHMTAEGVGCLGLFGCLESGEVRNLGVVDVNITGSGNYHGGLVGLNYFGHVTQCYSTGAVSGNDAVGGLVGLNWSTVTQCYSSGTVHGAGTASFSFGGVGGLVGNNSYCGTVTQCYSTGPVSGNSLMVSCGSGGDSWCGFSTVGGGLVGVNDGTVTQCYSSGAVSGGWDVGGLIGGGFGTVTASFWDTQTSGKQCGSDGGIGKTTAEMQTASTFLNAGWDFVGETVNGTGDTWWIVEGRACPRLTWEKNAGPHTASAPYPPDGAIDVTPSVVLRWVDGQPALAHDIYFGEDAGGVAKGKIGTPGVYCGRYPAEVATYDPGVLGLSKTYHWRVDEVNEADPNAVWMGSVWSFTTADWIIVNAVDDFESYIFPPLLPDTWISGFGRDSWEPNHPGNGTGSSVILAEESVVRGGCRSMPMDFNNLSKPWYSEAERTWATPQDWTIGGADTLTLYFVGDWWNSFQTDPNSSPDRLYVGIEDSGGRMAVVVHPDADAVLATEWQKWHIALGEVRAAGVDVAAVKKMVIGVGDRNNPKPGGTGRIYIDDIRLTKRMP